MLGRISKLLLAKGETRSDYRKDSCTTMALLEAIFASGSKAFVKYSPVSSLWISSNHGVVFTDTPTVEQKRLLASIQCLEVANLTISSVSNNPGIKIYGPIAEFFCMLWPPRETKWRVHLKMDPLLWKRGCFFKSNKTSSFSISSCIPFATILPIITWGLTCSIQKNMYNY